MLNVPAIKRVLIRNVKILVPEVVEQTQNAEWSVTRQFASAYLDTLEIHLLNARFCNVNLLLKYPLHAIQTLVDLMRNVANKMELEPVFVMISILAIHTKDVDQNVFSTQIVPPTRPVLETNVRILAQALVDKMPIVKL